MQKPTTIYCATALRQLWPTPLASLWLQQYPNIFDDDDFRITPNQPGYHFCEWFAAIHLFQRDGAHSLVEKYMYANHPRKLAKLVQMLGKERVESLADICERFHVQPPDLFVYLPDSSKLWFAEVKGPNDRLSETQAESHNEIARKLLIPVEQITIRIE